MMNLTVSASLLFYLQANQEQCRDQRCRDYCLSYIKHGSCNGIYSGSVGQHKMNSKIRKAKITNIYFNRI
jgi:uncharacterized protein with FMN-binding domain